MKLHMQETPALEKGKNIKYRIEDAAQALCQRKDKTRSE